VPGPWDWLGYGLLANSRAMAKINARKKDVRFRSSSIVHLSLRFHLADASTGE
jgi:hypothetical protein